MNNKNTITLNGQISTQIPGLLIQELPPISKPLLRAEKEEIDGRDGDIITPLGYSSYDKEITIGLHGDYDINQVIAYFNGEGTVIFSNEPDKYYNYQILDQIDFERLVRYRTATVTFHVQPFKYAAFEGDFILDPPAANLLTIPDYTNTTNGVTVTASDGTVTITGTPTAATEVYLPITSLSLDTGTYLLSATSSGTNPTSCSVRLIGSAPSNVDSLGGKYITLDEGTVTLQGALSASKTFNYIWFYINAGQTLNFSVTFALENQAQKVVSGEGSSLALIGTTEAPFSRFDIKGDTYQQTYSGKNLISTLNMSTSDMATGLNSLRLEKPNSRTVNVYFTGTIPAGTYTFSYDVSKNTTNTDGARCSIFRVDGSGTATIGGPSIHDGHVSFTFTSTTELSHVCFFIGSAQEDGATADITNIQLEAGSTATDFEPYVGGTPLPNPDYPQEVQVVKHQDMLRLTGKNMVNVDELYLPADIERTDDGFRHTIESEGLVTYFAGSISNPLGVYTVSFDARIANPDEAVLVLDGTADIWDETELVIKDKNGNVADEDYRTLTENWKRYNFTVTALASSVWTPQRAVKLYFTTYTNSPIFELRNFQIELGATATEYDVSRTQMYPINFRTGKNMLSEDFLIMGDMAYGTPDFSIAYRVNDALAPMKVKPNTSYTISTELGSTVKGMRVSVTQCDANTLYLEESEWQQLASSAYTFTTRSDAQYIKIKLSLSTTSATVTEGSTEDTTAYTNPIEWLRGAAIQVEAGNSATAFEEYESMELCKIGNYQDYITKSGDDWYLHKETGSITLNASVSAIGSADGSSTGSNVQSYNGTFMLQKAQWDSAGGNYDTTVATARFSSNIGTYIAQQVGSNVSANSMQDGSFCQRAGTNDRIYFKHTALAGKTGAEVRALLEANSGGSNLYYTLATPTDTKITSEETIEQLNALMNQVHAYKDITFISSLTGNNINLPPIIAAEVVGSSDGVVTNAGNFPAKPKLTIYGSGNIGVSLNGIQIFEIALGDEGYITIDTAAMEAYQDTTDNLKNRLVVGDYNTFLLNPGENSITFSGTVTKCIVENYSRWL